MALQLGVAALTVGCIYALIALSFSMVFSATGVLNFAQGEIAMLGALFGATFFSMLGLPYPVALVLTVAAVAGTCVVVERLTFDRLIRRRADVHALIMVTLGLALLMSSSSEVLWGKDALPVRPPLGSDVISVAGARVPAQSLLVFGLTGLALLGVWFFYERTLLGKTFRAVAINREAARLMGIHVEQVVMVAFGLSGALAALAGLIFSPLVTTSVYMGTPLGVKGFAAALLGGLGSSVGAVLGGLVIGVLETFGAGYVSSGYRDAISFLTMLLVLFIRPAGLFGTPQTGLETPRHA